MESGPAQSRFPKRPKLEGRLTKKTKKTFYFVLAYGGSDGKELCLKYRRPTFDTWVGKIPWSRNGYSLQYSCLENPINRVGRPMRSPRVWTQRD